MQNIRKMVDVNTIIGEPIEAGGITLIPVSKVSFGFASGGSDFQGKKSQAEGAPDLFGGGSGAGVNIVPVAFVVIKGDTVRMLNVAPPAATTVDRVIELVPEMIDKIQEMVKKDE